MNAVLAKSIEGMQKSLTPTTGAALIDQVMSRILTETAFQSMIPLAMMPVVPAAGSPYEYDKRTAMASAYPEGSSATAQTTGNNSTYTETSVALKIIRAWGEFDYFVESLSKYRTGRNEVFGAAVSVAEQLVGQCFWGDATASAYMFDGWDAEEDIVTIDHGHAAATADLMDRMLDDTMLEGSRGYDRMFFMSRSMLSKMSQYYARTYSADLPISEVNLPHAPGGIKLSTWQDVPILSVDFCRPRAQATTLTLATTSGYGTLATDTYYVQVAPVTRYGEQLASAEAPVNVVGPTGSIVITLPAPFSHSNINSAYGEALYWKIYVGTTSGSLTLRVVTAALLYDANGSPNNYATTYTYTGTNSARRGCVGTATAGQEDAPLAGTVGGSLDEVIFLGPMNPEEAWDLAAAPYKDADELDARRLIAYKRLAETKDAANFLVKCYAAAAMRWPQLFCEARRVLSR